MYNFDGVQIFNPFTGSILVAHGRDNPYWSINYRTSAGALVAKYECCTRNCVTLVFLACQEGLFAYSTCVQKFILVVIFMSEWLGGCEQVMGMFGSTIIYIGLFLLQDGKLMSALIKFTRESLLRSCITFLQYPGLRGCLDHLKRINSYYGIPIIKVRIAR